MANLPLEQLFKLQPAHDGSKTEPLSSFTEAFNEEERVSAAIKFQRKNEVGKGKDKRESDRRTSSKANAWDKSKDSN